MTSHAHSLTIAVAIGVFCLTGCKAPQKNASEFDSLLRTVSYDTSVPVVSESSAAVAPTQQTRGNVSANIAEKAGSLRQSVGNGLKATAGVMLYGVFKIVESILGFDDDDDDDSPTPRGRADRNLNQWLDDRDRWERED